MLAKIMLELKSAESKKKVKRMMKNQGEKIRGFIQTQFLKEKIMDGLKNGEATTEANKSSTISKNPLL